MPSRRRFVLFALAALGPSVPACAATVSPEEAAALRPICENSDGKAPSSARIEACGKLIAARQGDAHARAFAHVNRAWAYGLEKKWSEALADYGEATRIASDWALVYNEKGLARLKMGKPDEAILNYDKAIRLDPHLAYAWYGRGLAKSARGQAAAAAPDFEQARKLDDGVDAVFERIGLRP